MHRVLTVFVCVCANERTCASCWCWAACWCLLRLLSGIRRKKSIKIVSVQRTLTEATRKHRRSVDLFAHSCATTKSIKLFLSNCVRRHCRDHRLTQHFPPPLSLSLSSFCPFIPFNLFFFLLVIHFASSIFGGDVLPCIECNSKEGPTERKKEKKSKCGDRLSDDSPPPPISLSLSFLPHLTHTKKCLRCYLCAAQCHPISYWLLCWMPIGPTANANKNCERHKFFFSGLLSIAFLVVCGPLKMNTANDAWVHMNFGR